ncbi:putative diphthamide synthesis protein [Helicosporidium sp. ATCC 50920]|nr:putative diphthamide synthesis protein [Helicosporidium sp. ATCC 50920]|eukprot:KDD73235.1 putative diphthamide synthesis protein [Helicosporidium sp. ATCC 50920]
MYIFVDISMDVDHLVESVCHSRAEMGLCLKGEEGVGEEVERETGAGAKAAATTPFSQGDSLVLAGTIQFASGMQQARSALAARLASPVLIPQESPLSPGEVLGCTAPRLPSSASAIVFVADGRFHLEALMLANPGVPAWRYDPYARRLSRERYDHAGMRRSRWEACRLASRGPTWALVLSTLGRQGNPALLERLAEAVRASGRAEPARVLVSELSPAKLRSMEADVDVWVQVACPRLSIDWGGEFSKPTLNPYEAFVALDLAKADWALELEKGELELAVDAPTYPMDYYSGAGGGWAGVYRRQEKSIDSKEARDAKRALALQRALVARQALLRKKDAQAALA